MPSSLVQAPLSPGSSQEVSRGSPQLPHFRWEVGIWAGTGRNVLHPASPSAFLFSNRVGSKKMSSAWAWGRGEGIRELQELPQPPSQISIFLRLCSAQGTPPFGVSEPALNTDASSSILWPAQGSWHRPPLRERDILCFAIPCRPALFFPSAHPGE